MEELLRTSSKDEKQPVSARALYEYLGYNTTQWKRWYTKNIINNQFAIENEDYVGFDIMSNGNETMDFDTMSKTSNIGGRPTMDFAITLDFAKKLSMQAKTEKGEKARNYFIACEAKLKEIAPQKVLTPAEMLLQQAQIAVEHEKKITAISNDVDLLKAELAEVKAKSATRPEYFTIAGYASLRGFKVGNNIAKNLGKEATAICKSNGYDIDEVTDPRWGIVGSYPIEVLNQVFEHHNLVETKSDLANIEKFAKAKSNIRKIEKDILTPDLEDLQTLPLIYEWVKDISKEVKNYPDEDTTEYKQLFIYIALMLFSPRFFAGEFLIRGLRDELAKLFYLSPSHISNLCRDVPYMYRAYSNFQKNADYIIAEVMFRIRSISMERMRKNVMIPA